MSSKVLRLGDAGPNVRKLQRRMEERGFSPGPIDGEFGDATKAALIALQHSEGLLADGVAGPRTLNLLDLARSPALPSVIDTVSVSVVSKMFPHTHRANIEVNLPVVLQALTIRKLHDKPMVLMALATIRAETESFLPVSEGMSRYNTSHYKHPFNLYDYRKDLGNLGPSDGEKFRGRGFVQLTGRANYLRYGPLLKKPLDLIAQPEQANVSSIASELLALFLGERELSIKDALLHGNFQAARRLVNGGTHGLDQFVDAYRTGDPLIPDTFGKT